MYHLLVKSNGWSQARDSIDGERVFEYTDDGISEEFAPGGTLDLARISVIPALLATETKGSGPQVARVGYVTGARRSGNTVAVEYSYDPEIAPVPNTVLEKLSGELAIARYEFSRTHWAIKDVDLFKVLLRNRPIAPFSPQVFKLDEAEQIEDALISVMMPFDSRFDAVYAALRDLATELKLECLRADDIWNNAAVIQDIVSLINRSKIVICDCSGRNPNVFYEVGIAHTLGREAILITQSKSDIPFDLRHLRFVTYLDNGEGRQELATRLKERIQAVLERV